MIEYQDLDQEFDPYADIFGEPIRSKEMTGFQGYDQWKTASPYDDEPDFIEEAENWIKWHEAEVDSALEQSSIVDAYWIMKGLLQYLEEQ